MFADYELIFSLRIGAILNVPIRFRGRSLGTLAGGRGNNRGAVLGGFVVVLGFSLNRISAEHSITLRAQGRPAALSTAPIPSCAQIMA